MMQLPTVLSKLGVVALGVWLAPTLGVPTAKGENADTSRDSSVVTVDTSTVTADTTSVFRGVPDTTSVDVHPQDSPENRGFLIGTPDGRATLRIRGSIRITGLYDINGLQNADDFATFDIPVGDANVAEPRFILDARQTRLGLEIRRDIGVENTFVRIEGDFRSQDVNRLSTFRLRHAYIQVGAFLAGQTWTTLADVSSLPLTVDFEGPNSAISLRTPLVRYSRSGERLRWAVALEHPVADVDQTERVELTFQSLPDVVGRLRVLGRWGHLQLAGIYRSISYRDTTSSIRYVPGYGGVMSGKFIGPGSTFLFQAFYGEAISRFPAALNSRGLDLVLNPNTFELEALPSFGGYVSVNREWRNGIVSYLVVGATSVEDKDFAAPDSYSSSQYIAVNGFWYLTTGTRIGVEYLWGRRENKDGQDGTANRAQFAVYYDF